MTPKILSVNSITVCRSTSDQCLRLACESLKLKFLSVFNSKLSLAQEDFRKSYVQVYIPSNCLTAFNTTVPRSFVIHHVTFYTYKSIQPIIFIKISCTLI